MYNLKKSVSLVWALLLCGLVGLLPGSSGASPENQEGLKKVALSLEKALHSCVERTPDFVCSGTAGW